MLCIEVKTQIDSLHGIRLTTGVTAHVGGSVEILSL